MCPTGKGRCPQLGRDVVPCARAYQSPEAESAASQRCWGRGPPVCGGGVGQGVLNLAHAGLQLRPGQPSPSLSAGPFHPSSSPARVTHPAPPQTSQRWSSLEPAPGPGLPMARKGSCYTGCFHGPAAP
ncbi:R-spondin-3 [Platysternon megacephalum]|uniref:R-spondin-3 n=1 Tax=Platysternon megacephalum TaxID=55544 RepID=A0A4D9DT99_9SAUR|nr:R-spondin-3 [Platysternon megacephalum]